MPKPTKTIKIIIDTNWWISLILSKNSSGLPEFVLDERIVICFSDELKREILTVLTYKHVAGKINRENLLRIDEYLNSVATFFNVTSEITICPDPKDNFLLSLANDAKADYLLTADPDLLNIKQFNITIICSVKDFADLYYQNSL
ncbi:MAG: putative toxin-antitoxin system toxin component, PIN family [Chitinophagaceae bacterium]|nr:putative toxin-antitoxin system toxin component, PIN family [Chitinophagaceae bacterium]